MTLDDNGLQQPKSMLVIGENWVLEECLEGFQISVESYTYQGKTTVVCIHDKLNPIEPPLFRVFYSATPSPRISNEGKVQLLEINARTDGGLIIPSAYYSTNINLYTVAIDLALGQKPDESKVNAFLNSTARFCDRGILVPFVISNS